MSCLDFVHTQRLSRRRLLEVGTLPALGCALPDLLSSRATASLTSQPAGFGKAKSCILIFMWGGPSQLDTWDLKADAPAEIRGEFKPIATDVPGIQISEHFPLLAQQADQYAIIRSLTHDDPAHLSSVHHLMTGRHAPKVKSDAEPPSRRDWPHLGSMLGKMREARRGLPGFVMMPWYVNHPAAKGGVAPGQNAGQLGPGFDPMLVAGDPNALDFNVTGLGLPADLSLERLESRHELLKVIDSQREATDRFTSHGNFSQLQQQALDMILSPGARGAFDLNREPVAVRDRYGRHTHGQCLLLARRLVESGVSLVCVNWHNDGQNFWDTHNDNFKRLKGDLMPPADQGFSALLDDLSTRGILDSTLVLWVGEFGRKPRISRGGGREHWPRCYSGVVAGGGVRGGQVYGQSDPRGEFPASDPVSPADLTATAYHALGIEADRVVADREGRPISLTEGKPVTGLFG